MAKLEQMPDHALQFKSRDVASEERADLHENRSVSFLSSIFGHFSRSPQAIQEMEGVVNRCTKDCRLSSASSDRARVRPQSIAQLLFVILGRLAIAGFPFREGGRDNFFARINLAAIDERP